VLDAANDPKLLVIDPNAFVEARLRSILDAALDVTHRQMHQFEFAYRQNTRPIVCLHN
jgi:hypothetical protein